MYRTECGAEFNRVVDATLTPRVSIVLPVFNASGTLRRAIRSIRDQTFTAWELILVNDGSTDESRAIIFEEMATDSRLVCVTAGGHYGIVNALNVGIGEARGEFIARMDADDECLPERLAAQVAFLEAPENRGVGLVSCLVEFGGDRDRCEGYAVHVDWINSIQSPQEIALRRFVESPFAHPSVMFRHRLITEHGGYREGDFPEDYDLWLRWLGANVRMAKIPLVLLRWNDPADRLSRTDARYSPAAFYRLKAPWLALWLAADPEIRARDVWVWGAGRPTRKRVEALDQLRVRIAGYIDVDPKKLTPAIGGTGRRVISPAELPPPGKIFVLVYVSTRGARELIAQELRARGYVEGVDFLLCA